MRKTKPKKLTPKSLQIEALLEQLSWEQKIGQMLMARGFHRFPEDLQELLAHGLVGGIQVNKDLDAREEIAHAQRRADIPLFIAADMETGFRGRAFQGTSLPCQMALGAINDEQIAYEWARRSIGSAPLRRQFRIWAGFGRRH